MMASSIAFHFFINYGRAVQIPIKTARRISIPTPTQLPEKLLTAGDCPEPGDHVSLDNIEEMHIRRVLASAKSLHEAADILGLEQATLWRHRIRYNI
jgi:transcriptional regulator with PAS, ATPase and Fis domain